MVTAARLPLIREASSGPIVRYPTSFLGRVLSVASDGTLHPTQSSPYSFRPPLGAGQDDWPDIVAALSQFGMVQLQAGQYQVRTLRGVPNNSVLFGTPNTELAAFGVGIPAFFAEQSDGALAGTQQAVNTRFSNTVLVDTPALPGTIVSPRVINGLGRQSLPYKVLSSVAAGPNYTWTLDREVNLLYSAGTPWQQLVNAVENVALIGNGMKLTAQGEVFVVREGYNVAVQRVVVSGERCDQSEAYAVFATGIWGLRADDIRLVRAADNSAGVVCWACRDGLLTNINIKGSGSSTSQAVGIDRDDSVNVQLVGYTVTDLATGMLWSSNGTGEPNGSWFCDSIGGVVADCRDGVFFVEGNRYIEVEDSRIWNCSDLAVSVGSHAGPDASNHCSLRDCTFSGIVRVTSGSGAIDFSLERCDSDPTQAGICVEVQGAATVNLTSCQLSCATVGASPISVEAAANVRLRDTHLAGAANTGIATTNVACVIEIDAASTIANTNSIQIQPSNVYRIQQKPQIAPVAMPAASGHILTFAEYQCQTLEFSGALTASTLCLAPALPGMKWIMNNNCSGSPNNFLFATTADDGTTPGQKGFNIAQGSTAIGGVNSLKHSERLTADVVTQVP